MLELSVIEVEFITQTQPNRSAVNVYGPWGKVELFIEGDATLVNDSSTVWLPALLPIAMALKVI